MNMILIRPYLHKFQLVTLLDVQTNVLDHAIYCLVKHRSPVLGGQNQMIDQYRNIMALM